MKGYKNDSLNSSDNGRECLTIWGKNMSDEYDEIRQACDDKIAAAMRRVAELKTELAAAHEALRIANGSADDQMYQKREALKQALGL